jgi:hypothetical protein
MNTDSRCCDNMVITQNHPWLTVQKWQKLLFNPHKNGPLAAPM